MTTTQTREPVHVRFEQVLGVTVKVAITAEQKETRRYRATIEHVDRPGLGLTVGVELGWGKTPAHARRRAVEKIANRRRGPARSRYVIDGVTFGCFPNPDDQAPAAHAFLAQIVAIAPDSPLRGLLAVGQMLAQTRNAANTADRAYYLVGQLAERARLDQAGQRRIAAGEQVVEDMSAKPSRWDDFAVCRQVDPDLFYPDSELHPGTQTAAISICERCPVQVECLARALDQREPFGVWGGTSEAVRRDLLRIGVRGDVVRARGMVVLGLVRKSALPAEPPAEAVEQVEAAAA